MTSNFCRYSIYNPLLVSINSIKRRATWSSMCEADKLSITFHFPWRCAVHLTYLYVMTKYLIALDNSKYKHVDRSQSFNNIFMLFLLRSFLDFVGILSFNFNQHKFTHIFIKEIFLYLKTGIFDFFWQMRGIRNESF